MKSLERIEQIIGEISPDLPDETGKELLRLCRRAKTEEQHLTLKYEQAVQEKEVIYSLLQKASDELIERYRTIFEHSGVPMVILTDEGIIIRANSHFTTLFGIQDPVAEAEVRFFDLLIEPERETALVCFQDRRPEKPSRCEITLPDKDGDPRFFSISVGVLPDGDESIVSIHEITELKKQRIELTAHKDRLETLLTLYQMTDVSESEVTSYTIQKGTILTSGSLGFICFVNEEDDQVTIEALWSAEEGMNRKMPAIRQMALPIGDLPVLASMIRSKKPVVLTTHSESGSLIRRILVVDQEIQRVLLIPVIEQERVVAIAGVADKPSPYDESDQLQLTVLMAGMWRLIIRNRQEEALKTVNKKLSLLSTLTRHDILNLITALTGYMEISEDMTENSELLVLMKKEVALIRSIGEIISFTSDYELVGMKTPVWQEIGTVFAGVSSDLEREGIRVSSSVDGMWIYADPLLARVFANFIDNSLRHGHNITAISLSSERKGDDLILIYSDDGEGVATDEKEKIFLRGYGKHTGLGLFLIREIFAITRITIREKGIPGEGVRFEMNIPRGNYRQLGIADHNGNYHMQERGKL
ncbi:ATP-binding protein [uncultured Methanospirillum sp.]|uniref:ATP-binding protein n=1 Tax=uncultured Methanospirillum sp. TaxID=262503 RepID=UPI0029C98B4E|nr:ATP-binding protein [uncultured Methanospirillum sp.]